jgi:hypothetical protein
VVVNVQILLNHKLKHYQSGKKIDSLTLD